MPPYKSNSQRRKFHALLEQGKIKKSTVDEFDKASKGMKLPDKVSKPVTLRRLKSVAKSKKV